MEFIKDVVVAFDEPDLFVPVIQLIFVDGGEFDSVGIVRKLFDGQRKLFKTPISERWGSRFV